jgi:hypothetical protein
MNGFFDSISVGRRGYDPILAKKARANIAGRGREIGTGVTNQVTTGLQNRGLGRSAGMLNAVGLGTQAQSGYLANAGQQFNEGEQQFTEGNRRFDTGIGLALKQLFLQRKKDEESQPGWMDILGSLIGGGAQVGAAALGKPPV